MLDDDRSENLEGTPSPKSSTEVSIEELSRELRQLKDLFTRRLLEDKLRSEMQENLAEQMRQTQSLAELRYLEPLFRELLLAIDRLEVGPASEDLNLSFIDEVKQILSKWGCSQIPFTRSFEPKVHEVVDTTETMEVDLHGTISETLRAGYMLGERTLRPAKVTTYRFEG